MSEHEAVEGVGAPKSVVQLQNVVDPAAPTDFQGQVGGLASAALDYANPNSNAFGAPPSGQEALLAGAADKYNAYRDEMSSGGTGFFEKEGEDASEDRVETKIADDLTSRVREFYVDMTVFQVAWRMAQKLGQDVSTLTTRS